VHVGNYGASIPPIGHASHGHRPDVPQTTPRAGQCSWTAAVGPLQTLPLALAGTLPPSILIVYSIFSNRVPTDPAALSTPSCPSEVPPSVEVPHFTRLHLLPLQIYRPQTPLPAHQTDRIFLHHLHIRINSRSPSISKPVLRSLGQVQHEPILTLKPICSNTQYVFPVIHPDQQAPPSMFRNAAIVFSTKCVFGSKYTDSKVRNQRCLGVWAEP